MHGSRFVTGERCRKQVGEEDPADREAHERLLVLRVRPVAQAVAQAAQ